MRSRFSLSADVNTLSKYFGVSEVLEFTPRYNIAPSQNILTLHEDKNHKRRFVFLRWGFIPKWMKKEDISSKFINAHIENAKTSLMFKSAFSHHRCLIVATSFFEWQQKGKTKQPFVIHQKGFVPFATAGLYSTWQHKNEIIESCTILTTEALKNISSVHHRMPLIQLLIR